MAMARLALSAGQSQGPRPVGPPTENLGTAQNAFGMPTAAAASVTNPFGGGGGNSFGTQSNISGLSAITTPFGASATTSSIFGNPSATTKPNLPVGFGQTGTF